MEWGDTQQFDVRHRFVATASYELPFGKSLTGVAHGLLSAWQVNATGLFAVRCGVHRCERRVTHEHREQRRNAEWRRQADGEWKPEPQGERANGAALVRHQRLLGGTAVLGRQHRLSLMHGPSQRRLDMSLFKDLSLGGSRKVQLRAEIYNVTNTPSFWLPDFNFGSTGFREHFQHGELDSAADAVRDQVFVLVVRRKAGHISGLAPPTPKKGAQRRVAPLFHFFLQIPSARRDI
jgi:hypothetical protein